MRQGPLSECRRGMLFPTVTFAIFFVVVLCINWLLMPRPVAWRLFIIGASWFFYGWWDERFVALLAASTIGNYLFGVAIWRSLRPTLESGTIEAVDASPRERGAESPVVGVATAGTRRVVDPARDHDVEHRARHRARHSARS